jgi:hypothetical protein
LHTHEKDSAVGKMSKSAWKRIPGCLIHLFLSLMTNPAKSWLRTDRLGTLSAALVTLFLALGTGMPSKLSAQSGACTPPNSNPVVCENAKPGAPASEWDVNGAGDPSLQGFATDISVNKGQTVRFKVATNATSYRIDIYRLGYYDGMGARKVATVTPSVSLPQTQPACISESTTGLVDCGNWAESASWTVPADATSGVYIGRLTRIDSGGASHIMFVVRDDLGNADLLFQTSDTTWQAYNSYGGNSLYRGAPAGRAYKVSYNRPMVTRGNEYRRASFFGGEYPMVRWLEANGYHVSYATGVDTDRRGSDLLNHRVFLSVGHDEYWSGAQRANVEAAREAGVNLAFFSGNEIFWKTRWESSIDGRGTPYRTLVSYKETHFDAKVDPLATVWTGTWRDARFSPPADGGRPENALTGTIFTVNCCTQDALGVSTEQGQLRFWRNTSLAQLGPSQVVSVAPGIVGYEYDEDLDNGFRPAGLIRLSSATTPVSSRLLDNGSNYGPGVATHSLTLYRHASGALVFGAGLTRWAWALDVTHDGDDATPSVPQEPVIEIQQATVNLLGDMSAQPITLQPGLVAASPSDDALAPTSVITSPVADANVQAGVTVSITGTAADAGGGAVAGVEVSVDGGATWHRAEGTSNWSYNWVPGSAGTSVLQARASDDSGNLEVPSASTPVTVTPRSCPCTIWDQSETPEIASDDEAVALELGVKFRTDSSGYISALRFYKGAGNTGTHTGKLWTSSGTLIASLTFTGETSSGWQQTSFSTPVPVSANTTYVASYHTNVGRYSSTTGYFATSGVDRAPLHAPASGVSAGNGVYAYGASAFPSSTWAATNYWVDVVFVSDGPADTTPPAITGAAAVASEDTATVTWTTNESATARVDYGLTPDALTSSQSKVGLTTSHSVVISGLAGNTTYYYRVTSADAAGNATTAPLSSAPPASFATAAAATPLNFVADTSVNDFAQGTVAANVYLANTADGEVTLQPQAGSEFDGAAVPPGWSVTPWDSGGSTRIAAGRAVVDGSRFNTDLQFTAGRAVEFVATFTAGPYQHIGFGDTLNAAPWAIFSTAGGQGFFARTNNGASATDTPLPNTLLGSPHRYRIEWSPSQILYRVDGALVATHQLAIAESMNPIASEPASGGAALSIDWLRMTPYAPSATFTSRVLDAGSMVSWSTADWTAVIPAGTTLGLSARFGDTPIPDAGWTTYAALSAGGALSTSSRYVQYRATMTSAGPDTPVLSDVTFTVAAPPDGSPTLSIDDVSVTEDDAGQANAVFTVTLSAASSESVLVNYTTANRTAAAGDYAAVSGTLTFAPDTTTQQVVVAIANDTLNEAAETFSVNLSSAINAAIADASGVGTILDNDPVPALSIDDVTVTEGNTGTTNAAFTVTLSAISGQPVTVNYATADGTALATSDYAGASGTLTFVPGTTTQQIAVAVVGNVVTEPTEIFSVSLSGSVNATIADDAGVATILDNDTTPGLSIDDVSVTEGDSGTVNAVFTVTLSTAGSQPVTVNYTTVNGTAIAPVDYTARSGTLSIPAGTTSATITVVVAADTLDEADDDTFSVNLSGAVNAAVVDANGTGTIVDDDAAPTLTVANVSATEGNGSTRRLTFTLTLSKASGQSVSVRYATADGTAVAGSDYSAESGTVIFAAGTVSRTVVIDILGDNIREPNETFVLNLSLPVNVTLGVTQATGTILNND